MGCAVILPVTRRFIQPLVEKFETRRPDAVVFARLNRVLLLRADNGIPLDIALGALEFEQQAIARSSHFAIDDSRYLITCSAEDLIVHKAFASRPGDWQDVERILMRRCRASCQACPTFQCAIVKLER